MPIVIYDYQHKRIHQYLHQYHHVYRVPITFPSLTFSIIHLELGMQLHISKQQDR